MSSLFALVFIFLHKYLVPLLFAIGLMYFIYGVIKYFILGLAGDEGHAQHGRELLLTSISWFAMALVLYSVLALFGWAGSVTQNSGSVSLPRSDGNAGVKVDNSNSVLPVPNVPRNNND